LSKKNKPQLAGQMNQPPSPNFLSPGMGPQILGQSMPIVQVQAHAGPIPAPEVIAGYEKVLPGSADRIIKMAEKEQAHRQKLERRNQLFQTGLTFIGQLFAFSMGMAGVAGGVYLVNNNKSIAGFGVFFTSLGALVGIFFYNRKRPSQTKEGARH